MDLDPGIARYVRESAEAFPVRPGTQPWTERRAALVAFSRHYDMPHPPGLAVQEADVPAPGGAVPVRVYRPRTDGGHAGGTRPGIVFMHGGGWVQGNLETHDGVAAELADRTGAVVVSVDYRLAPEHPYPAAFEDSWAALLHVAAHGRAWGIDTERLAVAGDSAGANLAAALTLSARDRHGPALRAQLLLYPCLSSELSFASYSENAEAPILTSAAMRDYWSLYLGAAVGRGDPYAEPLLAASLAGLPAAFVSTARYDPVRDDGERYAERLREAGVPVEERRAERLTHGWLRARHISPDSGREFAALCNAARRLLH